MPGYVFYDGVSLLDNNPILGIATYNSDNPKTGDLVQTWVIRKDMHPMNAVNTGNDISICGGCPLRGEVVNNKNEGRGCYVMLQGIGVVYNAYQRGLYPELSKSSRLKLGHLGLRYGSYGDPVAIPMDAWDNLRKLCAKDESEPGYTHQWRESRFQDWSKYLMASTHSLEENDLAHSMGWRTFRTILDASDLSQNEIFCPASAEGNFRRTCQTCGACNGRRDMEDMRMNIANVVHGSVGKEKYARNYISSLQVLYV